MPKVSEIDRIIGQAYDCLAEIDQWGSLLTSCAQLVGGTSAVIYAKPRDGSGGGMLTSLDFDASYKLQTYFSYYEPRSPIIARYRGQPEGRVRALGDFAFSPTYRNTEYFQDWVRPQGFGDMIGGHLVRTEEYYAWLSIRRAEEWGLFAPSEIRVAERLARHLGRVISLRFKLDMERNLTNNLRNSLDLVGFGFMIVDLNGKVLIANRAADMILNAGDGLKSRHRRLICEQPREASALQDAIRAVAQSGRSNERIAFDFCVNRKVAHCPLTVHVVPMPSIESWRGIVPPTGVAGVFLVDPLSRAADVDGFASAYYLTIAERRVLRQIVQGSGLVEAASKLRVAVPTARTQLQHIFEKTNVNSQAELVRLVMMSPLQSRSAS